MPEATAAERLAAIDAAAQGRATRTVTILGGGIAGIVAAHELERVGFGVRLLEARARTQGRIRTHRFEDGTYGELGPMRIPIHHDLTRHYIAQCGLSLRPFVTAHQNLDGFYDIAGVVTRMRTARRDLYSRFDLSAQQRDDEIPPKMLGRAVSDVVEGLTDAERESLRSPHLVSDRLRALDSLPMGEFLRQRCGADAAELIGAASGLETMFDRSTMMLLRDALVGSGDGFDEIVGGLDRLPEALTARLLHTEIVTHAAVAAIRGRDDGRVDLVVRREDGTTAVETPEVVLCTIPFAVLRRLDIDSAFSRPKLRAIRNLGYMSSTKVLLHTRERVWESRDGIVGGASQSDRVWRAAYYPSDNAVAAEAAVPAEARFNTMYGAYEGGRFVAADPTVSAGPGVLLGSYTWGQDARRLGSVTAADRADVVTRDLARLHPALAEDGMVDGHASIFWDRDRWAAGSFSEPGPGDHTNLYADAIAPDGPVHFAGEHCSTDPGWIQGAIASSLDAVRQILESSPS
jgi:monoamine oxidase